MPPALPDLGALSASLGISPMLFWILFALTAVWIVGAKGYALWHAARNYQRAWFLALLIINTFGILEIIYVVWFRADKDENRTPSLFNTPEGPVSSASA